MNSKIEGSTNRRKSTGPALAILAVCVAAGAQPGLGQQSAQKTFTSAAEASQSLFQAVQQNNKPAIENILGGPSELASSRDEAQDKADREMFVQKYQEMHRLARDTDGSVTLYIGPENWPFPIPLVESKGTWHFDPEAGSKEVLFRRIGENELAAIATCHEFVAAEKRSGTARNTSDSAPASLAAKAARASAGGDPVLLYGYYFRLVTQPDKPGTFIFIAYPAEYRSSGVMTFIVTGKSVVYEKDLGRETATLARGMTAFHKDSSWRAARE